MAKKIIGLEPTKKLPIWATLIQSLLVFKNYGKFVLKILLIPFCIYMSLELLVFLSNTDKYWYDSLNYLFYSIEILLFVIVAVNIHRMILVKNYSATLLSIFRFKAREIYFMLWLIYIFIIMLVIFFILSSFVIVPIVNNYPTILNSGKIFVFFLMLIPTLVITRLTVVYPATAIDKEPTRAYAFYLTKGNGFRLFLLVGFIPLFLGTFSPVFYDMFPDFSSDIFYFGLRNFMEAFLLVFEVSLLSYSFKFLTENE